MTNLIRIDDEIISSDSFVKLLKLSGRFDPLIDRMTRFEPLTGDTVASIQSLTITPTKQFSTPADKMKRAILSIREELTDRIAWFENTGNTDDDADFLRFLSFLESNFEKIVLLGDIWETLTSKLPWTPRHALEACYAGHPEIAKRFQGNRYQYVHGNHDIVSAYHGVPEFWNVAADGVRLHFTHGHMHDLLIRRARWASELAVCFGAWLRRFGFGPLYRVFEELERAVTSTDPNPEVCTFQRWAVERARRSEADIVVTGHTHISARSEHQNGLFLNSGSCSYGNYSFLSLDTRRGDYRVCSGW